ncbi:conserved hypothetical protein [Arthrobacter sp. Hiyo6]|nr:conserved hypothetical protein [Arthrobacter sp. Hiyo6]
MTAQPWGRPSSERGLSLRNAAPAEGLRRPFFVAAVVVFAIAVLAEIGLALLLGSTAVDPVSPAAANELGVPPELLLRTEQAGASRREAASASLHSWTGCCCSPW